MESIFNLLHNGIALKPTGLLLGLLLIGVHVFALLKAAFLQAWLKKFPRNKTLGTGLLFVALLWSFIVLSKMDMGEFYRFRPYIQFALPIGFYAVIRYADEFLSVRALGTLLMLLAAPVLRAAFLQPPVTRLFLPVLAYAWIVLGILWVGFPYRMRDQIGWLTAKAPRWNYACYAGIAYGIIMLLCAVMFY